VFTAVIGTCITRTPSINEHQNGADGNRAIGDVKSRKMSYRPVKIQKVDNVAGTGEFRSYA
jgi:hypothetical protein